MNKFKIMSMVLGFFGTSCGMGYRYIPEPPVPVPNPIEIVDPCGDHKGHPDEIVLIFSDGSVLAWYKDLGFSVLEEGVVYQTTDKQKCKFKIENGQVIEI